MIMEEVDICLRPAPLPPIIQVILVYHWFLIVVVMTEVGIGIRPANFIPITMVDYKFTTQGSLKKLFQEVCKEKFHIKSSLLLLSNRATTPSAQHATTYLSKHATTPNFVVFIL